MSTKAQRGGAIAGMVGYGAAIVVCRGLFTFDLPWAGMAAAMLAGLWAGGRLHPRSPA